MIWTPCHYPHPDDQVCPGCDVETCAECLHSVEDDAHADGCTECACPLHLTPGDDQ